MLEYLFSAFRGSFSGTHAMEPQLYERFFEVEERFWWSVGTRRVFFGIIDELLDDRPARVLDVGCGTGIMLKELSRGRRQAYGSDRSELALSFCKKRGMASLVRCDATQLPFATDCVDLVTALDVIEHLDEDEACVREMARICRRGGHLLLHVPAFPFLWSDKDDLNHHRRRYRRGQLLRLVEGCNLRVERIFYFNCILFPVAVLRSLLQSAVPRREPPPIAEEAKTLDRLYRIPAWVNRVMIGLMDFERRLVTRYPIPFGMSLVCLAQKPR